MTEKSGTKATMGRGKGIVGAKGAEKRRATVSQSVNVIGLGRHYPILALRKVDVPREAFPVLWLPTLSHLSCAIVQKALAHFGIKAHSTFMTRRRDAAKEMTMENGTTTLRDLMFQHGANSCTVDDAGNGCAGFRSAGMEEISEMDLWDVELSPTDDKTAWRAVAAVIGQSPHEVWASDWIVTGDGHNPYRFRVLF